MRAARAMIGSGLLVAVGTTTTFATQSAPANDGEDPKRPVIGLVLAGGGARGAAHVGALQALEELRIPVDFIVGTSMGAIVGGLYAAGLSPEEMAERFDEIDWVDAFDDNPPRTDIPFRQKEVDHLPLFQIEMGYGKNGFGTASGFVAGQKLGFILRDLTLGTIDDASFDDLPIPFRAVAADLDTGEIVVLDKGDLALAIRASMSFPGMFTPVEIDGRRLVDGGVLRNLPVDVALEMGADIVIAIDVSSPLGEIKKGASAFTVLRRSYSILSRQTVQGQRELLREQDFLITPDLKGISTFEGFDQVATAIERGADAAREQSDGLRKYTVTEARFAEYLKRQRQAHELERLVVDAIDVQGVTRVSPKLVARRIHTKPGDELDMETLAADLKRVYLIGEFEQVAFDLESDGSELRLVIRAEEKSWGPWYMRPGAAIEANTSGLGTFVALGMLRRPFINRLGAEWRSFLSLGNFFGLETEFYQPIEYSGHFFVAPRVTFIRNGDEYLVVNNEVTAVDSNRSEAGFDLGYQIGAIGELRAGFVYGEFKIAPLTGVTDKQKFDLGYQRTQLIIDQVDDPYFPRHGTFARVELAFSRENFGADDEFDRLAIDVVQALTAGKNTWLLGLELGTELGSTLPFYADFGLGGFLNLSGFDRDALAGPDLALGRVVYYRQIGEMPTLLGGDVYLGASLEAGNTWASGSSHAITDLLLAGSVWAGMDTVLGPMYAGYGIAEGGNDSFYFFLGRIF
jgi:NTE family protein